jgi:hypothetical protein
MSGKMQVIFIVAWADECTVNTEIFTESFRAAERANSLRKSGFNVTLDTYEI